LGGFNHPFQISIGQSTMSSILCNRAVKKKALTHSLVELNSTHSKSKLRWNIP